MEQEKTQILMKDNKQTTSGTILKEQWDMLEHKKNISTNNAEINKKNFLGEQKCTVINK